MNPADQRVTELVDKWLKSLELHLAYTNLTDEAYWQVQPWVRHQRPARWILDLAHSRAKEVKRQLTARIASGDTSFSETLELMAFLANLVGVQSIERFIPLAEPDRENREVLGSTHSTLQPLNSTSTQTRALVEPTREMRMPEAAPPAPAPPPPPPPSSPPSPADPVRTAPPVVPTLTVPVLKLPAAAPPPAALGPPATEPAPPSRPTPTPTPAAAPPPPRAIKRENRSGAHKAKPPPPEGVDAQVVVDAVRLIKWGREWHELAEAIARIADRPGVVEVRKILRTHKAEIERASAE